MQTQRALTSLYMEPNDAKALVRIAIGCASYLPGKNISAAALSRMMCALIPERAEKPFCIGMRDAVVHHLGLEDMILWLARK